VRRTISRQAARRPGSVARRRESVCRRRDRAGRGAARATSIGSGAPPRARHAPGGAHTGHGATQARRAPGTRLPARRRIIGSAPMKRKGPTNSPGDFPADHRSTIAGLIAARCSRPPSPTQGTTTSLNRASGLTPRASADIRVPAGCADRTTGARSCAVMTGCITRDPSTGSLANHRVTSLQGPAATIARFWHSGCVDRLLIRSVRALHPRPGCSTRSCHADLRRDGLNQSDRTSVLAPAPVFEHSDAPAALGPERDFVRQLSHSAARGSDRRVACRPCAFTRTIDRRGRDATVNGLPPPRPDCHDCDLTAAAAT